MWWLLLIPFAIVIAVAIHDLTQTRDPILRNYPVVGHGRHVLSELGPKLRQYVVADNNEERPFSRDQRDWVYRSAGKKNNYFGFGTDNDLERSPNYLIIKQATFPIIDDQASHISHSDNYSIPCAKILGGFRKRVKAFRPESIINVSAMSYGSLSSAAVEAINRGCQLSGCLHNTGEGGIARHHDHGGGLIWQLGTGYFGARNADGRFDEQRFVENCQKFDVRAVEVKLSQGAKPGRGGILPAEKITAEIASIRGIALGKNCVSPAAHLEFSNADQLLDFIERLADLSGLPIGIKSAVGELRFWDDLISLLQTGDQRGIDFITIDGGEGGTGAAPLVFSDHVSLPFKMGFSRVYRKFAQAGLHEQIVFVGSGKLGFPQESALAIAMGCDMIGVGREAMLAIGCIQAQLCHTGKCPTGVATQNKWLMRGLDPTDKSARLANYLVTLRKEILHLSHACGVRHPAMLTPASFEILHDGFQSRPIAEVFQLQGLTTLPSDRDLKEIDSIMRQQTESVQG